jgi:succinate dehydrogenase/fumarate reductase flavoprotein subunit
MAKNKDEEKKALSRREFLKDTGMVVGGAALTMGALSLAGCAPEAETTTVTAPGTTVTTTKTETATPWLPSKWDYEADVVVVGAGGAGLAAAIEAHDAGASVLILEKQASDRHYSNSRMSGGIFHCPARDSNRQALEQYLLGMMSGENLSWKLEGEQEHVSQGIVPKFADYEVENADWLKSLDPDIEFITYNVNPAFPMFPGAETLAGKYITYVCMYPEAGAAPDPEEVAPYELPKMQKKSGEAFHACLMVGIENRGIEILYSSPAKRLVKNNGEVIGVIAQSGGKEIACKAKRAVVLTSGGYEYNVPMRRAFLKGPGVKGWAFYGSPDNTGDGIAMALDLGAGVGLAKVAKAASRVITAVPYGRGYEETGLKMGLISEGVSVPHSIIVDNFGKRYWNEHDITNGAKPFRYQFYEEAVKYDLNTMSYTRDPSWLIFDESLRTSTCITSLEASTAGFRFIPWTKDNMDAVNRGWIFRADSVEELAAKIKADPENRNMMDESVLTEAVDNFNSYCAAGEDLEFGRSISTMGPIETPPFYALRLYPGGPNTKGSIDADGERHVIDWKGNAIPRLYTAGEISSVFKFVYQGGGNITECMVCGRIAGRNAATETPWG